MLHTPTIMITIVVLMTTALVVHCFNWWLHRPLRGPGWWVAAAASAIVGFVFIASRDKMPELLSILVGNAAVLAGLLMLLQGLRVFAGRSLGWRFPACAFAILLVNHSYFTLVENLLAYRMLVLLGLLISIKTLALAELRRIGMRDGYRGIVLMALSFTVEILFYTGYMGMVFLHERQTVKLYDDASALQPFMALAVLVFLMANTFGAILLTANRLRAELNRLALQDPLTGLLNRRAFDARLSSACAAAQRNATPLSLLLFDLDHFKQVNDTYGHPAGDAVLKHFVDLGVAMVRDCDDFARLGGEEFALLVPGADLTKAMEIGERLRAVLQDASVEFEGRRLSITVSVGVATLNLHGGDGLALMQAADAALYQAKRAGRNCVLAGDVV